MSSSAGTAAAAAAGHDTGKGTAKGNGSHTSTASATSSSKNNAQAAHLLPQYHPESKYQEPWKDPYLTLFDVHRQPRRIMNHPHQRVSLPLKLLGNEFQCPICLGYMKQTSIVMECLHRFCRDCIQKCLRLGKKQCPSCRIHIPSRRSLRPDPKFDLLIQHICGDLDSLEQQEEKEIEHLNRTKYMNNAAQESRRRSMLAQALNRKKVVSKQDSRTTTATQSGTTSPVPMDNTTAAAADTRLSFGGGGGAVSGAMNTTVATTTTATGTTSEGFSGSHVGSSQSHKSTTTSTTTTTTTTAAFLNQYHRRRRKDTQPSSITHLKPSELIEFQLKRHPQERMVDRLQRELICMNKYATIKLIKVFLSRKLSYYPPSHFQLLSTVSDSSVILDDEITLEEVQRELYDNANAFLFSSQPLQPPPQAAAVYNTTSGPSSPGGGGSSITTTTTTAGAARPPPGDPHHPHHPPQQQPYKEEGLALQYRVLPPPVGAVARTSNNGKTLLRPTPGGRKIVTD
eukprot:CAMPEP_0195284470 /NCGR_PEP_ID=MMETSP0707-20130614/2654_1 /TAXON_ID=33640 /ORGANISM="Asterionellopsis glacialis, Strain CCMP134" /LENGTH=511 /DNA_ID=CAMNT_0040343819 /DNA_START=115 /DNA_END=1650 /DNA_ORIENTATION=-